MRLALATGNAAKLAELRRILRSAAVDVEVLGLADLPPYPEPEENGRTFAENALLKAHACVAATGCASLADDSGLAVDVLNGMPGVRSARWSGPDATDASNNALLLRQLFDVARLDRVAQFVCAMAFVPAVGEPEVRLAALSGRLLTEPRGDNGFGYDPLFVADGQTRTSAELAPAEKDAISHRAQAIRAMVPVLVAAVRADREVRRTR